MRIFDMVPDAGGLLALEPEELGGVLLAHLNSLPAKERSSLNRYNFLHEPRHTFADYPPECQSQIADAFGEAWSWLEREGLLVQRVSAGSSDWFVISRRGSKMTRREDVDAYRRGNLLPREQLHPAIAHRVWAQFLRGEYDTAVFQAFREVEIAVRRAGGFADRDLGTDLMRRAFHTATGVLADATRIEPERQGMSDLFAGAIALYKNPASHRSVALDAHEAVELIVLASHLLGIVDARVEARSVAAAAVARP